MCKIGQDQIKHELIEAKWVYIFSSLKPSQEVGNCPTAFILDGTPAGDVENDEGTPAGEREKRRGAPAKQGTTIKAHRLGRGQMTRAHW